MKQYQLGICSYFYRQLNLPKCWLLLVVFAALESLSSSASGQCQLDDLWASDGGHEHFFGWSVGADDDFSTLIMGAQGHDTYAGAAYIFIKDPGGSSWFEQQMLTAPDPDAYSQFGYAVAMSGDGQTVVVAELFDDNSGESKAGAGHVFVFDGKTWQHTAKLTASDAEYWLWLGTEAAMTPDGNTIVLGAEGAGFYGSHAPWGAAYVYNKPKGGWENMTETALLLASDYQSTNFFSRSVAFSPEGEFLVVGDERNSQGAELGGAAYIFQRSQDGTSWTELQKIIASDASPFAEFGRSAALASGGDVIVIGAFQDFTTADHGGSAYIFIRQGDKWIEQARLVASDPQDDDYFGISVDISYDGNRALIGTGTYRGVFLFDRVGSQWTQQAEIERSGMYIYDLGGPVDLSPEGSMALLGTGIAHQRSGSFRFGTYL